jgi:hypothetical protein
MRYQIVVLNLIRFSFDNSSDADLNDLISELKVLQLTLPDRQMSAMKIFEFIREVDNYPSICIAYRILFTMSDYHIN